MGNPHSFKIYAQNPLTVDILLHNSILSLRALSLLLSKEGLVSSTGNPITP